MSERVEQVPVLVVGAGPAGLTAANALARAGVEVLLVEKRAELSSLPRATAVSLRSMELLRGWGLEPAIRADAPEVEWLGWISETLASSAAGETFPTGIPSLEQSALISPTTAVCAPQDHLEPVLLEALRRLPAARVELGLELTGVDALDGGIRATLFAPDGGSRIVEASYLIAADGAHSRTRELLGIGTSEGGTAEQAVMSLVRAPLWELVGERRYGLYSVAQPEPYATFLPAGRGDRWLFGKRAGEEGVTEGDLDEGEILAALRAGAGVPGLEARIERVGSFQFAANLAEAFRAGNAFLAGDAAHRVTPRGGTGMNMAIQGGFDLGWKLSWVLNGWAGPELLDTYEGERRPVARHNVERSLDPDGTTRDPEDEARVDLGARIPHAWTTIGGERRSTLDLLGTAMTLFTGPEDRRAERVPGAGDAPVGVRRLDTLAARALGLQSGAALLVRPDGAPAAWLAPNGGVGNPRPTALPAHR